MVHDVPLAAVVVRHQGHFVSGVEAHGNKAAGCAVDGFDECSVEYETRLPLFGMVIMRSKERLANWYRGKSNKRVGWLMVVNLRPARQKSVRWTGLAI